ncbi:aromatic alcohol reductase [Aspergillus chevalieri]|uniref:NmrA-like domain-containing protein n=1 Tax=Aspergillus chevalieri TaxID=182096 RepID=A0A7R7VSU1_ASPCH|nr:uncharacterized protein ACHE_60016S [Aspergillus chevalieri]BCR90130.1 hypothetical protein ACHE_60016S [Aspergillus chevalieri]
MSPKVAIAGASGNLGPAVLAALLDAGFEVTVLTRENKDNKFDERVRVAKVNYDSLDSLTSALTGQEVVVNTLGVGRIPKETHLRLIDASVAAKVQRFIPSEFGANTTNPRAAQLPVYADKVAIQKHLQEASNSNDTFSYTLPITGPFLDWGLKTKFILNHEGPEVELYDGGDQKFSATTLAGIGQAVSGIIRNLEATRNQAVYVREANVSQKGLLELSGKQLATRTVSTAELEKEAYDELGKPNPNPAVFGFNFLRRAIFGEGFGGLVPAEELSNDLLGVRSLSDAEIRDIVVKNT